MNLVIGWGSSAWTTPENSKVEVEEALVEGPVPVPVVDTEAMADMAMAMVHME